MSCLETLFYLISPEARFVWASAARVSPHNTPSKVSPELGLLFSAVRLDNRCLLDEAKK
jgi:hypothetical protein